MAQLADAERFIRRGMVLFRVRDLDAAGLVVLDTGDFVVAPEEVLVRDGAIAWVGMGEDHAHALRADHVRARDDEFEIEGDREGGGTRRLVLSLAYTPGEIQAYVAARGRAASPEVVDMLEASLAAV